MQQTRSASKTTAWALLFLPLAAVGVALALVLGWGHSSTGTAEATFGDHFIDFDISVIGAGCDTDPSTSEGTKCTVAAGETFSVAINLNSFGTLELIGPLFGNYTFWGAVLLYTGDVTAKGTVTHTWPNCDKSVVDVDPNPVFEQGTASFACGFGTIGYTGQMATVDFNCTGSGTIALQHGEDYTALVTIHGDLLFPTVLFHGETPGSEELQINCEQPVGGLSVDLDGSDGSQPVAAAQPASGGNMTLLAAIAGGAAAAAIAVGGAGWFAWRRVR